MKKEKTKTWYKKKLDKVFSQYIREKAEKDGIILCYICGKRLTLSTYWLKVLRRENTGT